MRISVLNISAARAPLRYLSCLRRGEIVALQGSPLLGFAVAIHRPTAENAGHLALLIAANVCLVAHIFLTNDWSGLTADLADPHKVDRVFTRRGMSCNEMAGLLVVLLALSLFLFNRLGRIPLSLALSIAALSALYSLPPFNLKGRPLLSSAVHVAGGALHFLLGYSVGSVIDGRAVAIASFFALTFAGGHLTQEVRDYQGDARSEIRTNAVSFGQRRTFVASIVLFTMAHALLFCLALWGILPHPLAALFVLYPLHMHWSLKTLKDGLTYTGVCRLQERYRALYAIIGVVMVAVLWKVRHLG